MLDENATIPVVSLPTIMAFYVQSFVCVPSLSSPLLLRISPHTFAFIPIPPMSLSSRNRSISNTFRHILPCIAPVYEGMHYHKTWVPWQMKSIFIIISYILSYRLKPWFYRLYRTFSKNKKICVFESEILHILLADSILSTTKRFRKIKKLQFLKVGD